jgi:hypothetical protein
MASIITATTTSGLTQSADNSGVLQLASGVGNLVTVPAVTGTAMVSGAMPAFSVYQNSAQSLTGSVFTKITFDTEEFDTNNNFASSRFTPTIAGYYQINSNIQGTAVSSSMLPGIFKNGIAYKYGAFATTGASNSPLACVSSIVYFNGSTDYVEIFSFTTTTQNTTATIASTYVNGCLVRAA